jgi:flagellin-like hook-associated protein FlgL
MMYSTASSVADLITKFRSLLTSATNAASTDSTNVTQSAQQMLSQMASLLNTQYDGGYLFGGSRTDQAPVDISSSTYPAATSPPSANTSYYTGDDQMASVRVSDSQTVSYGIGADNPALGVARHESCRQQFAALDDDLERGVESGDQRRRCRRCRAKQDLECIVGDRKRQFVPDQLSVVRQDPR